MLRLEIVHALGPTLRSLDPPLLLTLALLLDLEPAIPLVGHFSSL